MLAESEGAQARLSLKSVPAALLERGPARLAWVTAGWLFTSLAVLVTRAMFQPASAPAGRHLLMQANEAGLVVVSAALLAAQRSGRLKPITLLRLGLVFEVAVAAAIAVFENSIPWQPGEVVRGFSAITVWIGIFTLLVPMPPLLATVTGLLAASTGPAVHLGLSVLDLYPPLPARMLFLYYFPSYIMVAMAVFLSARFLRLEWSVARAREMGSYELVELIARGGMGEVWRAHHRWLKRDAAIKLIRPEALLARTGRQAAVMRTRFEHEAQTTASLRSPHTVELYDFGMTDEGGFFYAMEYLEGYDLERLVRDFGPQSPARVVYILAQACLSLEEAHNRGLVHRDIKPTNFFLCRLGAEADFVKLLDFGLVKRLLADDGAHLTIDGNTTGTPAFLSPEIAMGEETIDRRADIYGLGCVAYWLLTGQVVFEEKSHHATAMAHVQKEPVPPSVRSGLPVPQGLEAIVMACLEKKPSARPGSADALRRLLLECPDVPPWDPVEATKWWDSLKSEPKSA